jgi:hypothetical protein
MNNKGGFVTLLSYIDDIIRVMMNQEDIYQAEQDYARYTELFFNKEILTQEEFEFVKEWDVEASINFFPSIWNNTYLNLNLYSEVEKEESDLRKEQGI